MISRILVPLDGSAQSIRILGAVAGLSARRNVQVALLHVLHEPGSKKDTLDRKAEVDRARRYLEHARKWLSGRGIAADAEIRSGSPAEEIRKFLTHFRPSLIAMYTYARSGLSRMVRGSVAEEVMKESEFPVFLANPSAFEHQKHHEPGFRRILVPLDGTTRSDRILGLVTEMARQHGA